VIFRGPLGAKMSCVGNAYLRSNYPLSLPSSQVFSLKHLTGLEILGLRNNKWFPNLLFSIFQFKIDLMKFYSMARKYLRIC